LASPTILGSLNPISDPLDPDMVLNSSFSARARAYIELLRVSNLPSVFSNVLVGAVLGAGGEHMPLAAVLSCAVAVLFFYLGGVALNDALDKELDRVERPERPIPSGRLSAGQVYRVVALSFCLGLAILASISRAALGMGVLLIVAIAAYDLLHKRFSPSVLFIGAARCLVYLTAAAAVTWPLDLTKPLWFILTLAAYTTAFTIVARSENKNEIDRRRWIAAGIPLIVLVPGVWITVNELAAALGLGALMIIWQVRAAVKVFRIPPDTKNAVHIWLSGFCLMDAFYLSFVGNTIFVLAALVCFVLTLLLQRRFMGT